MIANIPEIISGLEEEPNWTLDNFGSMDSFKAFCSTMKIPKEITDIYDEHKARGELNDRGELEFFGNGEKYYAPMFVVYQEENEYRISYLFETYSAEEVIGQGCFKNRDGDNLVIISVLTYSNERASSKIEYLPEYYSELSREEISSDGRYSTTYEYLDTALLNDKKFDQVMVCPEFFLLFYPETNEFVCVKDSEAIGPRTKVDNVDLKGLREKGNLNLGIVNEENTLIYPMIMKNDKGTSFELLHVAEITDLSGLFDMPQLVEINGIYYPVADGNTLYYVEGAKALEYAVNYSTNLDWLVTTIPIIVNGDVILKQYDIDYNDFQQYELWDGAGEYICMRATNQEMVIWGRLDAPLHCIRDAQKENKFSNYIAEDGEYKIPTYSELQEVLNSLGILMLNN